MSPLELIQLIGYGTGAALHLWMAALLARRQNLERSERVLFALAVSIGVWHSCNLLSILPQLVGLDQQTWAAFFRVFDTLAVTSVTFAYSFLLHVHLHLWASAHGRQLRGDEKLRVYISYVPTIFLLFAIPLIWQGPYAPMAEKTASFVMPFALWAAYVLLYVSLKDILIARVTEGWEEKRALQALAGSFVTIAALILAAYVFTPANSETMAAYMRAFANLGSLLPAVLIAYYIYRYRYLELVIKESLVLAAFGAIVLAVYLYGIKSLAEWAAARFELRQGAVEALLILGMALAAAPFRSWLERRVRRLFQRRTSLFRDVVTRVGFTGARRGDFSEFLRFVEQRTAETFQFRRVTIVEAGSEKPHSTLQPSSSQNGSADWVDRIIELSRGNTWAPVETHPMLAERNYAAAFIIRRDACVFGILLVDAAVELLTDEIRSVLGLLADQIAIAAAEFRLVEENVRLERQVAQSERLAALGQMAATVAHEVKNPLSSIKSIAQVMNEDKDINQSYGKDLSLIVNEADRLSRSVTQLLSFAKTNVPAGEALDAEDLIRSVVSLLSREAEQRGVKLSVRIRATGIVEGRVTPLLREALGNLVLNAIQAAPANGCVEVESDFVNDELVVTVTDDGRGVPPELADRIWEPFFTTKQRGTGLGLAIVKKRIDEAEGSVNLVQKNGRGARFELRISASPGKLETVAGSGV